MQKNKTRIIYKIKTLLVVLVIFCSFAVLNTSFAQSFMGPSCAAGLCQGKTGVDSSGNVSMGTSTPQSGTKTLIISQTSDSSTYGLRVLSSNNSPLFLVRSDGKISIATSGASYALNVSGDIYASGNLVVGGTFSAPIPAGNVTPGVFNSLQGGGTGAYAFLGSLGIATSSQVGLPQSLSVYGGGYFSGNVGIGTTTPANKLHVVGGNGITVSNGQTLELISGGIIPVIKWYGSANLTFGNDPNVANIGNGSAGNQLVVITPSGNVGIGTTTPAYKLDVVGQINSSGGLCIAGDCKTSWSQVGGSQWTNTTGGIYYLGNVGIGTSAVSYPLFVSTSTDTLFAIQRTGASSPTIFKQGTDAGFVINNGGSDILTIKSGNVGIGTTVPRTPLDILSTSGAQMRLTYTDNSVYTNLKTDSSGYFYALSTGGRMFIGKTTDTLTPETPLVVRGTNVNDITMTLYDDSSMAQGVGGAIAFGGNDGAIINRWFANMKGGKENAISGDYAGYLAYFTRVNGGSLTEKMRITSTGNVGIGTTTPAYKLDVAGQINSSGGLCIAGDCKTSWSQVGGSSQWTNTTGGIYYLGNVGIGTSTVSYPLFVSTSTDTLFAIQRTGASSPTIFKQGTDAGFVINNGGSDVLTIKSGNVGIGTTAPAQKLDVNGYIRVQSINGEGGTIQLDGNNGTKIFVENINGDFRLVNSPWTAELFRVTQSGNVGIGTTTPETKLHVEGKSIFHFDDWGNDAIIIRGQKSGSPNNWGEYAIRPSYLGMEFRNTQSGVTMLFMGQNGNVGIGTTTPAYKLDVASGGSVTARFGTASSDTVIIGGGAGKINVGTVDPIYSISGKKYATYGPESIGVKVGHTGVLKLVLNKNKYEGVLDFKNAKDGDDLWLFAKTTNLASNFDKLTIQLTPAFKGKVWYNKDKENMIVKIYGEADELNNNELEVSYSLSAPRFDSEEWPNYSNDETVEGIKIY